MKRTLVAVVLALAVGTTAMDAQGRRGGGPGAGAPGGSPRTGTVERIKVHGKSLEGNLEGDSPDRDVSIYLPPSYATARNRRYPVVYLLHGYTNSDEGWFGPGLKSGFLSANTSLPAVAEKAIAAGAR